MSDTHASRGDGRLEAPDWQVIARLPEPRIVCPARGEQLQAHSASQRLATFLVSLVSSGSGAADLHLPTDRGLEIRGERSHVPDIAHLRVLARID